MSWDSEGFMPKNGVLETQLQSNKGKLENKFVHCAGCNELISVVSTTLYEIDNQHYCSACYTKKIVKLAVERDHFDLKQPKAVAQK
jgi:hypothetical protein